MGCSMLSEVSFPNLSYIGPSAFSGCTSLEKIVLLSTSVCSLGYYVFYNTPMSKSEYLGHFGSIYVPESLVSDYKVAKNWSSYAERITAWVE